MALPLDLAREEILNLIEGRETKYVLQKCNSCFACNFVCPDRCNPAQLILDAWHRQNLGAGLPATASFFLPSAKSNFRTYVLERLPRDEKRVVESWRDVSKTEVALYPGCNFIVSPYLTMTGLMDGMSIRGTLDLCCGEVYYRAGLYEASYLQAEKVKNHYENMGLKKLIVPCPAGLNMFTRVWPELYGISPRFDVEPFLGWLLTRIDSGRIRLRHRLDMRVTVQESCNGKLLGDEYLALPRKLLDRLGVEVVEQEFCRDRALCCGIGSGFSHFSGYHPLHITLATVRCLKSARKTGAEAIVVYCAGCLAMLSAGKIVYPGMPVYHILELVQMAAGEKPRRRQKQRAWLTLKGVAIHQWPKLLSRRRIFPESRLR